MKPYFRYLESHKASLWKGNKRFLAMLDMELTERCTNNCIHCYINQPSNDSDAAACELSTREIKDVLEAAVSMGCLMVRFTGGEPLLREDFEDIYLHARKLGLIVLIFTSATLITPALAELFVRIPPLMKIEVTVFGMNSTSYESVTKTPGSFEEAFRGINLLLEKRIPFLVKGILLPQNKKDIEKFDAWTSTLPGSKGSPAISVHLDLRARRDSKSKNRRIEKLRTSPKEVLQFLSNRHLDNAEMAQAHCVRFKGPSGAGLFSCGSGITTACVDAYGKLQPCLLLRHPDTVYDLGRGSLEDAMNHFFPEIRHKKALNSTYLARCARCVLKGLCEQCPAKSWIEHGDLDTPVEYLCEMTHLQARHLQWIGSDEKGWEVENWKDRIAGFTGEKRTDRT